MVLCNGFLLVSSSLTGLPAELTIAMVCISQVLVCFIINVRQKSLFKCYVDRQCQVNEISTLLHYYSVLSLRWFEAFEASVTVKDENIDYMTFARRGSAAHIAAGGSTLHHALEGLVHHR